MMPRKQSYSGRAATSRRAGAASGGDTGAEDGLGVNRIKGGMITSNVTQSSFRVRKGGQLGQLSRGHRTASNRSLGVANVEEEVKPEDSLKGSHHNPLQRVNSLRNAFQQTRAASIKRVVGLLHHDDILPEHIIDERVGQAFDDFIKSEAYLETQRFFKPYSPMNFMSYERQVRAFKGILRGHVIRSHRVMTWLNQAKTDANREVVILRAARRDYLTFAELRIQRLVEEACSFTPEEEEEIQSSKTKHYIPKYYRQIGWTIIVLYCLVCAFYICSFGINYGQEITVLWLSTFSLGAAEELIILVPFKLFMLFYLLPSLLTPRLEVPRVRWVPRYSATHQAARAYPHLRASKLILENDRSVQEELVQMRLASHHHSWTRIVMAALTLIITIMPLTAQEFFLEIMVAAFVNTLLLVFVQGHANYPEFFYPCAVALLLVPILNRLFRWWNKKRQKKKQQDGNAQGACDSPLPKGPSIRFWAKDEDFMDRSKEHSRTKSKSRAFSYLSPRRK